MSRFGAIAPAGSRSNLRQRILFERVGKIPAYATGFPVYFNAAGIPATRAERALRHVHAEPLPVMRFSTIATSEDKRDIPITTVAFDLPVHEGLLGTMIPIQPRVNTSEFTNLRNTHLQQAYPGMSKDESGAYLRALSSGVTEEGNYGALYSRIIAMMIDCHQLCNIPNYLPPPGALMAANPMQAAVNKLWPQGVPGVAGVAGAVTVYTSMVRSTASGKLITNIIGDRGPGIDLTPNVVDVLYTASREYCNTNPNFPGMCSNTSFAQPIKIYLHGHRTEFNCSASRAGGGGGNITAAKCSEALEWLASATGDEAGLDDAIMWFIEDLPHTIFSGRFLVNEFGDRHGDPSAGATRARSHVLAHMHALLCNISGIGATAACVAAHALIAPAPSRIIAGTMPTAMLGPATPPNFGLGSPTRDAAWSVLFERTSLCVGRPITLEGWTVEELVLVYCNVYSQPLTPFNLYFVGGPPAGRQVMLTPNIATLMEALPRVAINTTKSVPAVGFVVHRTSVLTTGCREILQAVQDPSIFGRPIQTLSASILESEYVVTGLVAASIQLRCIADSVNAGIVTSDTYASMASGVGIPQLNIYQQRYLRLVLSEALGGTRTITISTIRDTAMALLGANKVNSTTGAVYDVRVDFPFGNTTCYSPFQQLLMIGTTGSPGGLLRNITDFSSHLIQGRNVLNSQPAGMDLTRAECVHLLTVCARWLAMHLSVSYEFKYFNSDIGVQQDFQLPFSEMRAGLCYGTERVREIVSDAMHLDLLPSVQITFTARTYLGTGLGYQLGFSERGFVHNRPVDTTVLSSNYHCSDHVVSFSADSFGRQLFIQAAPIIPAIPAVGFLDSETFASTVYTNFAQNSHLVHRSSVGAMSEWDNNQLVHIPPELMPKFMATSHTRGPLELLKLFCTSAEAAASIDRAERAANDKAKADADAAQKRDSQLAQQIEDATATRARLAKSEEDVAALREQVAQLMALSSAQAAANPDSKN